MKKIIRYVILEILLLISLTLISTAVIKILDLVFKLGYTNFWKVGFKVGFIAWLVLLVFYNVIMKNKK